MKDAGLDNGLLPTCNIAFDTCQKLLFVYFCMGESVLLERVKHFLWRAFYLVLPDILMLLLTTL